MSHQPERKEKDCLNCGTQVQGRFCHHCGQENIVTKQNFWSITRHFIYDIFHFDGKFFDTLKELTFAPGKVPDQFMKGRRLHYLDPIRMYLFTSAIFFLLFFSVKNIDSIFTDTTDRVMTRAERLTEASKRLPALKTNPVIADSMVLLLLDTTKSLRLRPIEKGDSDTGMVVNLPEGKFRLIPGNNVSTLDTVQSNQSWVNRKLSEKWRSKKRVYGDNTRLLLQDLTSEFMHRMPYLLFLSLPLFGLILKLLYIRRRQFYYSDHMIFTLYFYIFSFILMMVRMGIDYFESKTGWLALNIAGIILVLLLPLYLFIAMKRFYGQGFLKTFVKFVIVNLLGFLVLLLLFLFFIFLSILF